MRNISIFGAAIISLLMLSACNTISGIGRDLESAGDAIEDAAEDNK
jgi:predicted small secreted protein